MIDFLEYALIISNEIQLFQNLINPWYSLSFNLIFGDVCDPMEPARLLSPWNSPGQNTGEGSHSLLQGIFPTQVSHIEGRYFTGWATREALDNFILMLSTF